MIITLVVDQFFQNTNGTSVSAQNLCRELEEKGHTVKNLNVSFSLPSKAYSFSIPSPVIAWL